MHRTDVVLSKVVARLLGGDVVVDLLVQADVDSLGYDVHLVDPEVAIVADLRVAVLVDLLDPDVHSRW